MFDWLEHRPAVTRPFVESVWHLCTSCAQVTNSLGGVAVQTSKGLLPHFQCSSRSLLLQVVPATVRRIFVWIADKTQTAVNLLNMPSVLNNFPITECVFLWNWEGKLPNALIFLAVYHRRLPLSWLPVTASSRHMATPDCPRMQTAD